MYSVMEAQMPSAQINANEKRGVCAKSSQIVSYYKSGSCR